MNIVDLLKLKELKSRFSRETQSVLWFAVVCTVASLRLLDLLFSTFLAKSINLQTIIGNLPGSLLLYIFAGLLFLLFIAIGYKYNEKIILLRKNKLSITDGQFSDDAFINNFEHQGFLSNNYNQQNCMFLCNSYDGLLTKKYFKNPKITFDTEITKDGFAFLIGARDFENYIMFRVVLKENEGLYIVPHLRKFGIWEIQNVSYEKDKANRNITIGDKLNFVVEAKKRVVDITIKECRDVIKKFRYIIPTHFALLPASSGTDKETPSNIVSKLQLSSFGKVGFRATGEEKTVILNIGISET